jgi:hypothetical protein
MSVREFFHLKPFVRERRPPAEKRTSAAE